MCGCAAIALATGVQKRTNLTHLSQDIHLKPITNAQGINIVFLNHADPNRPE